MGAMLSVSVPGVIPGMNESLAKGLATRLFSQLRHDWSERILPGLRTGAAGKQSPESLVKRLKKLTGTLLRDRLVSQSTLVDGKRSSAEVIFWVAHPEKDEIAAARWFVNPAKKIIDFGFLPLTVSRHVVERIILRHKAMMSNDVFAELNPAARTIAGLVKTGGYESAVKNIIANAESVDMASPHGVLLGKVFRDQLCITTFVDEQKLSPRQVKLHSRGLRPVIEAKEQGQIIDLECSEIRVFKPRADDVASWNSSGDAVRFPIYRISGLLLNKGDEPNMNSMDNSVV